MILLAVLLLILAIAIKSFWLGLLAVLFVFAGSGGSSYVPLYGDPTVHPSWPEEKDQSKK